MSFKVIGMGRYKTSEVLLCIDHRVSGKEFSLVPMEDGTILETIPQPSEEDLPLFYETDDYISHTDSKRKFQDRIYQRVKKLMLKRKLKWIKEFQDGGSILDVGAGTGSFLREAKQMGWEVYGVEPSKEARNRASTKGINLNSRLDFDGTLKFDVITLWHVLEHVPDFREQIEQLKMLLKPGGLLVIALPNFRSYDALKYNKYWAGYDVPRHLWHFSREGIKNEVSRLGLEFRKERPLVFDSFYVSLLSEKYKNGKTRLFSAMINGLRSNLQARRTGEYSSITYFFKKESKEAK